MALRDLAAYLEDDGLEYPLPSSGFADPSKFPDGKTYKVPSPSAKTGLYLTGLADLGTKAAAGADLSTSDLATLQLDDDGEKSLYQRVLGPVYDEMLADGVKWTVLQQIGQDAYLCFAMSSSVADTALSLGKAPPPNRRTRRAVAKKTAGRRSAQASTGAATATRRRASTGSSTSPNAPKAAAKAG